MDALDRQYHDLGTSIGVPSDAIHRLRPAELKVLAYLAENRSRVIAVPELARHIFGGDDSGTCRQVDRLMLPVRLAVRSQASIKPVFTNYRGRLAVGLQWQPKQDRSPDATPGRA